jgi:hypothetical protein
MLGLMNLKNIKKEAAVAYSIYATSTDWGKPRKPAAMVDISANIRIARLPNTSSQSYR